MSRIVIVPDTNFFLNHPDFVSFFSKAKSVVHLDVVWPVLCELDKHRRARFSKRQNLQDKGRKADQAVKLIKNLLENSDENLELEIYRPESLSTSPVDAQIVDCVVELATQYHPDDTIEFITDDEGLPTLLFLQEQKRHKLTNATKKTASEVQQQVALYGTPSAQIERIRINSRPSTVAKERGVELSVDFILSDMKGQTAQVGVYADDKPQPLTHRDLPITTGVAKEYSERFFLPYKLLGVTPGRYGMVQAKIKIVVWDLAAKTSLAQEENYCIDFALGSHFLTQHAQTASTTGTTTLAASG
jgi:hypothetical protein